MRGKSLSALLIVLRKYGVTKYATPELTIELASVAPAKAAAPEQADQAEESEGEKPEAEEPVDFRFALERFNEQPRKRAA